VVWGATPLVLSCYLTEKQPPIDLIVSARAVLTKPDGAVFVFDDQGPHVLPGGRREDKEPVLAALAREIREEAGCAIVGEPMPIGFIEFLVAGERPPTYGYPYPTSFHVVFAATAGPVTHDPTDPNVRNGRFIARDQALALDLPWAEAVFLTERD
jgi:8-oxo-dGTP pyrophosphatase MutT (NUDIX family)